MTQIKLTLKQELEKRKSLFEIREWYVNKIAETPDLPDGIYHQYLKEVEEDLELLNKKYKMEETTLKIQESLEPNTIIFQTQGVLNKEPVLKISKGKFYALGKEIEDTEHVYERFNEWLKSNKA